MAMLFAVPRLFLISKREADRPRLGRTPPELLPPGGVRTFPTPTRKQTLFAREWTDSASCLTGHCSWLMFAPGRRHR